MRAHSVTGYPTEHTKKYDIFENRKYILGHSIGADVLFLIVYSIGVLPFLLCPQSAGYDRLTSWEITSRVVAIHTMKEIAFLNPEHVSPEELSTYAAREAVRAVVLDKNNAVALLHATKTDYYKLPGGGIDDDIDTIAALERECREELGCAIEVVDELGLVNEWRRFCELHQISYCYVARLVGDKGTPDFTESEIAEGFEVVWLPYDEALRTLTESRATQREAKDYMVPRDSAILEAAKKHVRITNTPN